MSTRPELSADVKPPGDRRPWLPTALVGGLAALAMGGTALLNPFRAALGSGASEAPGHLFGLWATARNLLSSGPLVRMAEVGYPDHFLAHLMDPINLVVFLPFYWLFGGGALGATVAWNVLHLSSVGLGAWGCYRLARRIIGDVPALPWAAALMAAVFCMSPYMLYVPNMGRTEYLPAVLYPWHLALLHQWLRSPIGLEGGERGEAPALKVGLAAGLVLGAAALGGWYLAVFLALAEIPIALWLARGLPWREALWRLALVAGVSLLCTMPAAWALLQFPPDQGSVLSNIQQDVTPLTFPTDPLPMLFRIREAGAPTRWMDQPAYVGVVTVLLGIFAAVQRPRAALWPLVLLWLLSFAPGPFLLWEQIFPSEATAAEQGTRFTGWYLLHLAPPLRAIRTWPRIAVLAALPAGVCLAAAFAVLSRRLSPGRARLLALGLLALTLLDQATYPVRFSPVRPWFDATPPPALAAGLATLPEGAILQLPVDIPLRTGGGPEERGHYMLWHLDHGRATSASPQGHMDGTLRSSTIARLAVQREVLAVSLRSGSLDPYATPRSVLPLPTDDEIACGRRDARTLKEAGFAGIVLHEDRAGASELDELIDAILGDPSFHEAPVMVWSLANIPEADGSVVCARPTLPEHISKRVDRAKVR